MIKFVIACNTYNNFSDINLGKTNLFAQNIEGNERYDSNWHKNNLAMISICMGYRY